jgi:hypothetical protein
VEVKSTAVSTCRQIQYVKISMAAFCTCRFCEIQLQSSEGLPTEESNFGTLPILSSVLIVATGWLLLDTGQASWCFFSSWWQNQRPEDLIHIADFVTLLTL